LPYLIFSVENSTDNLLLVKNKNVINGGYRLLKDKKGFYIPRTLFRVYKLGKAPKIFRNEWGGIDCEKTMRLAEDTFYMPLFLR
jgi:hypothetical protein